MFGHTAWMGDTISTMPQTHQDDALDEPSLPLTKHTLQRAAARSALKPLPLRLTGGKREAWGWRIMPPWTLPGGDRLHAHEPPSCAHSQSRSTGSHAEKQRESTGSRAVRHSCSVVESRSSCSDVENGDQGQQPPGSMTQHLSPMHDVRFRKLFRKAIADPWDLGWGPGSDVKELSLPQPARRESSDFRCSDEANPRTALLFTSTALFSGDDRSASARRHRFSRALKAAWPQQHANNGKSGSAEKPRPSFLARVSQRQQGARPRRSARTRLSNRGTEHETQPVVV